MAISPPAPDLSLAWLVWRDVLLNILRCGGCNVVLSTSPHPACDLLHSSTDLAHLSIIICTNLHSLPQESCRQESSCGWCWQRPGWSAAGRLATYRVGGSWAGLQPACCRPALQKRFGSSANCSGITDGQILFEVYIDLQKCFIIV